MPMIFALGGALTRRDILCYGGIAVLIFLAILASQLRRFAYAAQKEENNGIGYLEINFFKKWFPVLAIGFFFICTATGGMAFIVPEESWTIETSESWIQVLWTSLVGMCGGTAGVILGILGLATLGGAFLFFTTPDPNDPRLKD